MRVLLAAVCLLALVTGFGCSASESREDAHPSIAAASAAFGYVLASGAKLQEIAPGGEARIVVSFDDGSTLMAPALSPDGRRIAFIRQEPVKNIAGGQIDFGADLYVVNRDGTGLKELAHHSALAEYIRAPSWLDVGQLFFSVRGRTADGLADYRVERMDLRSGQRLRVAANQVDPSVTPGATQLLTVSVETATTRETVLLGAIDGSNVRDLLPPAPVLTLIGSAVMSPDGRQIAFAAGDLAGGLAAPRVMSQPRAAAHPFFQDVWLIGADGSNLSRVAEVAERSLSLSWSPDGRYIYAMGTEKFRRIDPVSLEIVDLGAGAPAAGIFFFEQR